MNKHYWLARLFAYLVAFATIFPLLFFDGWWKVAACLYATWMVGQYVWDCNVWHLRHQSLYQHYKQSVAQAVASVCENYYKDTPITNYVVQLHDDHVVVKVGDDAHMVQVDPDLFMSDCTQALENAHMEWLSDKSFREGDDGVVQ